MLKKILVPLDGTLRAEQALAVVRKICSSTFCKLVLVEAADMQNTDYSRHHVEGDGTKYISSNPGESTSRWVDDVRIITLPGEPERVIIDVAEQEMVDLIVMVTHGYVGLERLLIGSVTEKVIRYAPCPVLAIRDDHIPKHFLVALDGTPFSETIINPAYNLARLIKADITLARIHIAADDLNMRDLAALSRFDAKFAETVLQNHNKRAEFYLQDFAKRYSKKSYEINIDYDIDTGPAASRLARIAKRNKCDLIAMATHGRNGLDRLLNGSVTENVMHRTDTAMLVIHPDMEADK